MFYTFTQNNSGGYFVTSKEDGVGETVIIEALGCDHAVQRLNEVGQEVSGFDDYCECCGERWSTWIDEDDADEVPMIYGVPITDAEETVFRKSCFTHYLDGRIEYTEFKKRETEQAGD